MRNGRISNFCHARANLVIMCGTLPPCTCGQLGGITHASLGQAAKEDLFVTSRQGRGSSITTLPLRPSPIDAHAHLVEISWSNPSCFADLYRILTTFTGQPKWILWICCAALCWTLSNIRSKFTIEGCWKYALEAINKEFLLSYLKVFVINFMSCYNCIKRKH